MATPNRHPQAKLDDTLLHNLKPVSTKPKQPGGVAPVLPASPFQPTSQSHVAAVASSLLKHASSDLAQDKAALSASAPVTPVLPDSPYQPSSHQHVAQLAHAYTSQANSSSSAQPGTPQHTPVLADSGDFQPGCRSHVAQLISQVTSRLQAQSNGNSGDSSAASQQQQPGDLPYQPDSREHVSELVKTFKQAPTGSAGGSSSRPAPVHGSTPHNTPLARTVVGTFFTKQQQQHGGAAGNVQPAQQEPDSSSNPAAVPGGPEIIHLAYGKGAPFKGLPGTSRVAAVAHQLEKHRRVDNDSSGNAASSSLVCEEMPSSTTGSSSTSCAPKGPGSSSEARALQGSDSSNENSAVSTSDVLQSAVTPSVSNDGVSVRLLPPSRKPQVVAARLSGITLEGAKVALQRTASAEVAASLASDSGQNMNPLYRPLSDGLDMTGCTGVQGSGIGEPANSS